MVHVPQVRVAATELPDVTSDGCIGIQVRHFDVFSSEQWPPASPTAIDISVIGRDIQGRAVLRAAAYPIWNRDDA
jgi:hypothetical protein